MKHKCKRMFSVDSQIFFIKNQIPLHIRDHLLRFDFQLKKPKNHWSLKRGFFLLKRTLSDEAKSFWRDRRMKEASDGDASQRRQELPREYFTFWQHGFENEKKLFFRKNEKNNFFVYFLYFLFHFHRIPMTCCQNVLIAAETKFCQKMKNQSCSSRADFFLIWALFVIWFSFLCSLLHYKWLV